MSKIKFLDLEGNTLDMNLSFCFYCKENGKNYVAINNNFFFQLFYVKKEKIFISNIKFNK